MKRPTVFILVLALLWSVQIANAKESLPIKHGLYVPEGANCPQPHYNCKECDPSYDDGILYGSRYVDDGFYDEAAMQSCEFIGVKKKGNVYYITKECFTGVGYHSQGKEKLKLTIFNDTSFSIVQDGQTTIYKHCSDISK